MRRTVVIALTLFAVAAATQLAVAEPTYIGADKCKMCHKLQYNSWAETKHAQATADAKASTDPAFSQACLSCHATDKSEDLAGVQCEACHGPGSDYKAISVMKDKQKAVANGLILPDQKTCDGCHDGKDHHKKVDITKVTVHAHKS